MRLFVFSRHGESTYNAQGRINGDPSMAVPLTIAGRQQAHLLGAQIAHLPVALCVHTRFGRTEETAQLALAGRNVPVVVESLLDDVAVGSFEGRDRDTYRTWRREHGAEEPLPGGESLSDAAQRYARGFSNLLSWPEPVVFVVCHEIAIRYALNAVTGSRDLDQPIQFIPNAVPFLFCDKALTKAVEHIQTRRGR